MAVSEERRYQLHRRADEVLGADHAMTLMESLPPTGWGDVATRQYVDLRFDSLEARIDARFEAVDSRFEVLQHRFEARLATEMRKALYANVAAVLAAGSLAMAAAKLIG